MNTIHSQIMQQTPDIFVLTDTRSDGATIKSQWDWKDYQIRECKGVEINRQGRRAGGVFVGVRKNLPIIQEHSEVEGLDGRLLHVTIKMVLRGKGKRLKIIGIYAPPANSQAAYDRTDKDSRSFYEKLMAWMVTNEDKEWIMAGDFNCTLSRDECLEYFRHQSHRPHYRTLLASTMGHDWWERRDRSLEKNYTRKAWIPDQPAEDLSGKTIIDRIASSSLFQSTEINNRPDLFVGRTDHIWVHGFARITEWERQDGDEEASRQWIERRVRIPRAEEKQERIARFQGKVRQTMKLDSIKVTPIQNDQEFDMIYNTMTSVIVDSSFDAFGHRRRRETGQRPRSPQIVRLVQSIRQLGRIIAATKENRLSDLIDCHTDWVVPVLRQVIGEAMIQSVSLLDATKLLQKAIRKQLYKLEKEEAHTARVEVIRKEAASVLAGTRSAKKLAGVTSEHRTPTVLTGMREDGTEWAVDKPDDIKQASADYVRNLFTRRCTPAENPACDKPWMSGESASKFKRQAEDNPMNWPPNISTADIQRILKKGKARPSPGPDLWEKWCLRHLPKEALDVVTEMVRYIISRNYFPPQLKETILLTIFKKGDTTRLENYEESC
jgi:exonuclease III